MTPTQLKQHWDTVILNLKAKPELLDDKRWRITNLYIINTKSDGKQVFKLTRAQKHFLDNMRHRNIILKSRQLGFSTLITLWILDEILFNSNKEALAIAHIKEGMTDIFDKKVKFALINLPESIGEMFKYKQNSKTKLQIVHGKDSYSNFGVALSGRSGMYHYVHISEFAKLSKQFPLRAAEVMGGTLPAVPFDGYVFIESTAEGATGEFYDEYQTALETLSKKSEALYNVQFYPHFYNWTWDDMEMRKITEIIPITAMERGNINWEEYQMTHKLSDKEMTYYYMRWLGFKKNLDKLNQEYPTTVEEAFVSTGKPYFNIRKVVQEIAVAVEPKYYEVNETRLQEVFDGPLMVWHEPQQGHQYVMGVDTAEGLAGGDSSTMAVIDVESREVCALYKDQVTPDDLFGPCIAVANYYNKALIAVEVNKDGNWVVNEIDRAGYTNVYCRQKIDDITKQVSNILGWKTDTKTRDSMLTELRSVYNDHIFRCKPLLSEMMSFIRNARGKPEAMYGKHDDLIIAAAIAFQVRKLWYVEKFRPMGLPQAVTSRMDIIFGLRQS